MNDASLQREIINLACDLIAFESTADRPSELKAAIDYVEQYARQIDGALIQRYEVEQKPGLIVTLRDTHTPALLLNGHLDVV
ncbi:MAG: M20 family peptidase, partial [Roseiflexus sp.]|nr:M20 family peptidase [Roseiflexus sp.]